VKEVVTIFEVPGLNMQQPFKEAHFVGYFGKPRPEKIPECEKMKSAKP